MSYEVVGTWRQFFHWGPLLALGVIGTVTSVTVNIDLMWWPPLNSVGGFCNLAVFLSWVALTLFHYFSACIKGPGFVCPGWKPKNPQDFDYLQYCEVCEGYKAPRSHHCRKCGRCVMKMDHHCPWINTCCGHLNHGNFCLFLVFAPFGCIHAVCILVPAIYRALNFHHYYYSQPDEPLVYLGVWGFVITMFGVGLAIGVILAVGMLFYIQFKSILKNESGIESWIIVKALHRIRDDDEGEFIYPYNLGWKENLKQVFHWSGRPKSDGYTWDVVDGCNQYTLTIEQLIQKQDKRERTVEYAVIEDYSGAMFPVTKGLRVGCCVPCTDEPRIKIEAGEIVNVTRWKKRWLYGSKVISDHSMDGSAGTKKVRGWFPKHCAVAVNRDDSIYDESEPEPQDIEYKKES